MENTHGLRLRRAEKEDCRFLYELRNEEEVRKNSFQTGIFSYEDHVAWFERKLEEKNTRIYILEQDGERIGQARVDLEGQNGEISYALCLRARGRGYSKWMLGSIEEELREQAVCRKLIAEVKRENIASQKIFETLSYIAVPADYGYVFEKKIPLFTIIMCTYNSAQTLATAVESVRNQEFGGWEMQILDNGSKDESVEKLQEYEKSDDRIKCIYRKDNIGWGKGISECLKTSAGGYMMFLGADDYLATEHTLTEVADEVKKNHPQIIFTGTYYAKYEQGEYHIIRYTLPENKVYKGDGERLIRMMELMRNVYYNSAMHYLKIDFLKQNGMDFYDPFYIDSQTMTEAIVKAEKIVVMSQPEYVLTLNTSQPAKRTVYDYNVERQWNSIKEILPPTTAGREEAVSYVARRVLDNIAAMCQSIVLGEALCDREMITIEKSIPERFARVEEMISTDAMCEMMNYAGREEYAECLIGAAGVTCWICKKNKTLSDGICHNSKWLAEFVEVAMEVDETTGMVVWKKRFDRDAGDRLLRIFQNPWNRFKTGVELVLKDDIWYENIGIREKLCEEKESGVTYARRSIAQ